MAGLRAKQKADRERRILDAAATLFRTVGYESATIEKIAELAEVSVGTLYNYYENKGDLLVAIVALEVNEVLRAGEALLADPPDDVHAALTGLLAVYLDHSLVYLSKEMWRYAMAISTQQPETRFGRAYSALDERLCDQVCALVRKLQLRGRVAAGIDARAVGELVFNAMNNMFITFVKDEAMSLATLNAAIARQNRPLTRAIAAPRAPRAAGRREARGR
jgi:AcrR family transcriptional regulator